jgi:hypothetical protein
VSIQSALLFKENEVIFGGPAGSGFLVKSKARVSKDGKADTDNGCEMFSAVEV